MAENRQHKSLQTRTQAHHLFSQLLNLRLLNWRTDYLLPSSNSSPDKIRPLRNSQASQ